MKTSTLIFNVAGIIAVLAIFIGVVDLMKHRPKPRMFVTSAPPLMLTTAPPLVYTTMAPATTLAPRTQVASDDRFTGALDDDPLADLAGDA